MFLSYVGITPAVILINMVMFWPMRTLQKLVSLHVSYHGKMFPEDNYCNGNYTTGAIFSTLASYTFHRFRGRCQRDAPLETWCQQNHCFLMVQRAWRVCLSCIQWIFSSHFQMWMKVEYSQLFSARNRVAPVISVITGSLCCLCKGIFESVAVRLSMIACLEWTG